MFIFKLFILVISLSINSVFSMESPGVSDDESRIEIDPKEEVINIPWDKFYLHNFVKALPNIEFDSNGEQVIKDLIIGYPFLGVKDQEGNTPFLLAVKRAVELEEKFVTQQSPDSPNEDLSKVTLQKLNNIYKFIDIIMDNEEIVHNIIDIADNDDNTAYDVSRKFYDKFGKDIKSRFLYMNKWLISGHKINPKMLVISKWSYERIQRPGNLYDFCRDHENRLLDYLIRSNVGNIPNILLALLNQPEIQSAKHDFSHISNLKLSLIELVFFISIILEESVINKDIEVDQEISKIYYFQRLLLYKLFDSEQEVRIFGEKYKLGSAFGLFTRSIKAPMFFKLIKSLKEQFNTNDSKIILALDDLISLELIES